MNLHIRNALVTDMPGVLEIYNEVILNSTAIYQEAPRTLSEQHDWFASKQAAGHPVLVCEEEGRILGYASYGNFRPWHCYRFTIEHSVHVREGYRSQGIGRRLLSELIELARSAGFRSMIGAIDADNGASIGLHESIGFKKVGLLPRVGFKFDRWLDLALLQLEL